MTRIVCGMKGIGDALSGSFIQGTSKGITNNSANEQRVLMLRLPTGNTQLVAFFRR